MLGGAAAPLPPMKYVYVGTYISKFANTRARYYNFLFKLRLLKYALSLYFSACVGLYDNDILKTFRLRSFTTYLRDALKKR